jgi:hypothetical protein
MTPAQIAYEADVAKRPTYHDGTPRKTWAQLGDLERSTWAPRMIFSPLGGLVEAL